MKKLVLWIGMIGVFLGISSIASAITVTDWYGDKDFFGAPEFEFYSGFDFTFVSPGPDDGITDRYYLDKGSFYSFSWSHDYDFSILTTVTSASLELHMMGPCDTSDGLPPGLYMDDQLVGVVPFFFPMPQKIVIDLMPFVSYLDGTEIFTINNIADWALDYSLLTVSDDATPIPEPATILLLVSGLVLGGIRNKCYKQETTFNH